MRNEYELHRHKKSDKIKWVLTGIAFLLMAVMLTGVCLQIFGTGKLKPSEWFTKTDMEQIAPETPSANGGAPVIDENGNEMSFGQVYNMPTRMAFRSAASLSTASTYNEVTIEAVIKPVEATNKSIDWSVAFKNPASAWATGKVVSDYVTVTPESDGSATAKVKCLKDFGEQIKITATSRMNTSAKADCAVDFMKRVKDVDVQYFASGDNGAPQKFNLSTARIDFVNTVFDGIGNLLASVIYTDFTVDEEISVSYNLGFGGEAFDLCVAAVGFDLTSRTRTLSTSGGYSFLGDVLAGAGARDLTVTQKNAVVDWMRSNLDKSLFYIEVRIGGTNARYVVIPIYISAAGLTKMVETVELNNSTILI